MPLGLPSELAGPAFLAVILAVAIAIAFRTEAPRSSQRVLSSGGLLLAIQTAHVGEEFVAGFHLRMPRLVGLDPWSPEFFVTFNLGWIALWALALRSFARGAPPLAARAALWFLALAALGNAVWHPALSLATLSYFPGTVTALPMGLAGLLLVRDLAPRAGGEFRSRRFTLF